MLPRLIDAGFGNPRRFCRRAHGLTGSQRGEKRIVPRAGTRLEKGGAGMSGFAERGGLLEGGGANDGLVAGLGHEENVS